MAIIPTGSGNGLARHLRIPLNLKKAVLLLNHHKILKIDTGKINNKIFIGVAGVGFDAHIGWLFSKSKKRGFLTYAKIALNEFFKYSENEYIIKIGNETIKQKAFFITLANSNQFGNNVVISPKSNINDGYLRVIILKKFPFTQWLNFLIKIFNFRIDKFKYWEEYKTKKISIEAPTKVYHIDGEPIEMPLIVDVEIVPSSLNVIINQ